MFLTSSIASKAQENDPYKKLSCDFEHNDFCSFISNDSSSSWTFSNQIQHKQGLIDGPIKSPDGIGN